MPQLVMREAIKKGLEEALQNDPNVLILGEDIGAYGGAYAVTDGFLDKFGPERIKDTPISEATFIGTGIGAASAGLRPIIELMSISFSLVGFDQIVNMAANIRYMSGGQIDVPMVIRAPTGAGVQLAATHSQSFETWLAEVPGLYCVCPSNPKDALGLLRTAIKDNNPVIFAEPALLYGTKGDVPEEYYEIPLGSASVVKKGNDITLVSYGAGMKVIEEVSTILDKKNISSEIIDLRSLSPIDYATIGESVKKTNKLLALDTSRRNGGIMAEVVADVQENFNDWLDSPIIRIGAKDVPWPYNKNLESNAYPDPNEIVDEINNKILNL
ncbi:MAG: alpha-ketoacid dehydrogenase subunit beta [SAR202 cluster bacterium]|jgi:pyruvate dehydrogenase E1 component beta subunit|nr:MAG: alpha-ketoacid dehydrogenase subunit beta [SAR202 cluster bacterium]KAA1300074.1 MAG: alpha-ketoacid dehydrogenase subunit beta [SAR202 cluster bacterium]|tara:strand:- start:5409 stop:6389 length:981 start_codon:yes stop_codon:yes gene_type:complete